MGIAARHTYKENKYAYMLTDITKYTPSVTAFEVGSRGFVTRENRERLKSLYRFFKSGVKFKSFVENVSLIAVNASYAIFLNRKEMLWPDTPHLTPSFHDGS